MYVSERVAEYHRQEWLGGGPGPFKRLLLHGGQDEGREEEEMWLGLFPSLPGGLHAVRPFGGWSRIQIPGQDCYTDTMVYTVCGMEPISRI